MFLFLISLSSWPFQLSAEMNNPNESSGQDLYVRNRCSELLQIQNIFSIFTIEKQRYVDLRAEFDQVNILSHIPMIIYFMYIVCKPPKLLLLLFSCVDKKLVKLHFYVAWSSCRDAMHKACLLLQKIHLVCSEGQWPHEFIYRALLLY